MRTKITELLNKKGHDVVTIDARASVREAVSKMVGEGVGSVVVVDGDVICGILTERDCVHRVILEGRNPNRTGVSDVMTTKVLHVAPHYTVRECLARMTKERCRHLPVLDEGRLVGLISIGDCTAHLSQAALEENGLLREYITGRYPG